MPRDGRWRTLIIAEVIVAVLLLTVLVAIMLYAYAKNAYGISWFSVGIAASAVLAEIVRRFRHLRNDIRRTDRIPQ
jgi:4-amino-4-deoxy-L-arabinose transferase-like glycosyltransferase